ncbi:cytochrome c oxidase assembly protein [Curtobacterium sp. MCBA15_012]|uniref:cytochrome c oxidase assembly protein n=1 Tax=Curtobacterium sp. MCBA15_012 TaxID=1898738 RepID=UPI000A83CCAE|nr:cytochrome c oxidase assembly protein [Curtobacterium sp. MCBA15_012]WIB00276.1 cytochrome c oxidase assembly protein [Curtobacterium sp. MCBA15_012]
MPDTTRATLDRPAVVVAAERSGAVVRALPWAGAVVAVVIVVVAVEMLGASSYDRLSRGYPGMLTSMLSALLRLTADITGGLTVGGLAAAAFLTPRRSRTLIDNRRDLSIVRPAATAWLIAAVLLIPVDAADANGQPLTKLLTPGAIGYLVQASYLPGAWIVVSCVAVTILVAAYLVRSWVSTLLLAGIGVIGLLAPVLVTQVLVGPNHDFGGDAAIFATPALGIWIGATAALARRWRASRPGITTIRRHRVLALAAWITWTLGSVIIAAVELAGTTLWAAPTGILFAVQILLVAAVAGPILLRRPWFATRTAPSVLLSVLLIAAGIGVVMARIPPPVYFVPTDGQQLFLGYQVNTPLTPITLWTAGRVNILFLVIAIAGIASYAAAVVRLRIRGDHWSNGRTSAWMLGWASVIITTSSGVGPYSSASFAVHMGLHMSLNMLCPLLLVLGGPLTLFLRATTAHRRDGFAGPHEWLAALTHSKLLRVTYNPMYVLAVFVGSYYAIYLTPFFDWAMRYHWAHQAMTLHYLAIGYVFYALIIGVDAPPRPLPHIGKLGLVLAAMPFHAFFGVVVMTSTDLLAGTYFQYLDIPWIGSLAHDQYVAGGVAWAAGELPLIVVVIALVTQWAKQDSRQAKRIDRHADRGLDDDYEQYNAMLGKLTTRDTGTAIAQPREVSAPGEHQTTDRAGVGDRPTLTVTDHRKQL